MKHQDNQHFSHHHVLIDLKLDEGEEINCNGCERLIDEPFHDCLSCNYWLHDNCLNTPRFLQHPSHLHPLTLLPTPTYSSRSYTCNACLSHGHAFSLSCAQCDFDLHVDCASLPSKVLLDKHPHELKLIFGSPYEKKTIYVCDECSGKMDPNHWLYYCAHCDFGVHLDCAMPKSKPTERENQKVVKENQRATSAKESANLQKSVFEAQREMMETHIAHKLVLEALDNAADYVGPSRKYYYY